MADTTADDEYYQVDDVQSMISPSDAFKAIRLHEKTV